MELRVQKKTGNSSKQVVFNSRVFLVGGRSGEPTRGCLCQGKSKQCLPHPCVNLDKDASQSDLVSQENQLTRGHVLTVYDRVVVLSQLTKRVFCVVAGYSVGTSQGVASGTPSSPGTVLKPNRSVFLKCET